MPFGSSRRVHRPRELRRRVLVAAQVRLGNAAWADACILNISSTGLLIRSARPPAEGSPVELRRDDHLIRATVIWNDGIRAGLKSDERVPMESIVSLQVVDVELTVPTAFALRFQPCRAEKSRTTGRAIEFVGAIAIGLSLAAASLSIVEQAFVRPLALVVAALGG